MAHPFEHARSSAKKFGGKPEDYLAIHRWFDESKEFLADFRHRALRHHTEGIFLAERIFGVLVRNSDGTDVPVRYVGETACKGRPGANPHGAGLAGPDQTRALDVRPTAVRAWMPRVQLSGVNGGDRFPENSLRRASRYRERTG